jgi:multiple sugar transport system permease protein
MSVAGVDAAVPRSRGRSRAGSGLSGRGAILLVVPALLPIMIFSAIPLLRGIYLGFTDSQAGLGLPTHFVGLKNFRDALNDDQFVQSFKIGLIWAVSVTAIQFVLALGLALLLNAPLRGRGVARALSLVPWAMPPVIVGIMWKLVYQQQAGVLNEILYRTHLPWSGTDWLADFSLALPAAILVGVWAGMPQTTVALLAGLQTVPEELHEAAAVDGAGSFRRFRSVTVPQIVGVIVAITTLDFVWNFNSFGLLYVLTEGGPGGKTQVPMLFAYDEAFKYGQFGYAAALGDLMVIVIAIILSAYLWRRFRETA